MGKKCWKENVGWAVVDLGGCKARSVSIYGLLQRHKGRFPPERSQLQRGPGAFCALLSNGNTRTREGAISARAVSPVAFSKYFLFS